MSDHEPTVSPGVIIESVKLKPATDWIRLAFDTFLASVVVVALVATRVHDAPPAPAPAPPPVPAVQPTPPPVPTSPDSDPDSDSDESGTAATDAATEAVPASGLPAAAARYARTLPGTFAEMAKQIRLGKVTHRDEALAIAKAHGDAMGTALDQLFDEGCDEDGEIVKPKFLSNQLDAAAAAVRAN